MTRRRPGFALSGLAGLLLGASSFALGVCGPFADVTDAAFCPYVLEIFTLGITTGTTPATYDPAAAVSRLQMAAFLSRTVDGVLQRGSRRAALRQFWTPSGSFWAESGRTSVASTPAGPVCDGRDVWVAGQYGQVSRVRASDGRLLETWTGASGALRAVVAMGRVFVAGGIQAEVGHLYMIDPREPAGSVTTVADLGLFPFGLAFDGQRVWAANLGPPGSVSIVTPAATTPWSVSNVAGFDAPFGMLFDGTNIWLSDNARLLRLDPSGAILQSVTVGTFPGHPAFDGFNIWVPNSGSNSVSVLRASSGSLLRTLTGNGLSGPSSAAFDGQRILVTNYGGSSVSLWRAADLAPLGEFSTGGWNYPEGGCSDGVNFWVAAGGGSLLRF